jgi:hypothetical protein
MVLDSDLILFSAVAAVLFRHVAEYLFHVRAATDPRRFAALTALDTLTHQETSTPDEAYSCALFRASIFADERDYLMAARYPIACGGVVPGGAWGGCGGGIVGGEVGWPGGGWVGRG